MLKKETLTEDSDLFSPLSLFLLSVFHCTYILRMFSLLTLSEDVFFFFFSSLGPPLCIEKKLKQNHSVRLCV